MVTVTVTIGGTPLTGIMDLSVKQSVANYKLTFTMFVHDPNRTFRDTLQFEDEVVINIDGEDVFNGILKNKSPDRLPFLNLKGKDLSDLWSFTFPSKTFVQQSSSQMLLNILASEHPGIFTTTGVQPTAILRDRTYKRPMEADIYTELAKLEEFVIFVDENKDVQFRPETFVDSGKHYDENQILDHNFESFSDRVFNRLIFVYGANLDKAVIRKNQPSIDLFKVKTNKISRASITSRDQAVETADFELLKSSNPVEPTRCDLKLDATLRAGEIIWLTIPAYGFDDDQFVIFELEHKINPPKTILQVGFINKDTSKVVQDIIRRLRELEEDQIADTLVIETIDTSTEEIQLEFLVTVERRTITGAIAGEFTASQKRAGQRSGAFTPLFTNESALVMNKGIENFLRIIAQIATVPTLLENTTAHVAIGISSVAAQITDSGLTSELARSAMNPSFPRHPSPDVDGQFLAEGDFFDSDFNSNSALREWALLDNSVGGDMWAKYVHTSNISKMVDEELRTTFKQVLTAVNMTPAGLNKFRDLIINFASDYLDNTNVSIEVQGSETVREVSVQPFFKTEFNKVEFEITLTNPADISTGATITTMKLFNLAAGGTEIMSTTVATITTEAGEENVLQQQIEVIR